MNRELRGKLLIAPPQLGDYFHRTVVLVVEHTEEGAMGRWELRLPGVTPRSTASSMHLRSVLPRPIKATYSLRSGERGNPHPQ